MLNAIIQLSARITRVCMSFMPMEKPQKIQKHTGFIKMNNYIKEWSLRHKTLQQFIAAGKMAELKNSYSKQSHTFFIDAQIFKAIYVK